MWNRYVLTVDRLARSSLHQLRRKMGHDLVAMEIKIDPLVGASTFVAAE